MTTADRDKMVARLAVIGMAACSGTRGNALAAGTATALGALERLGASTDFRDADEADLREVCEAILGGTIRANDAQWMSGDDGTILPRLARLALESCETIPGEWICDACGKTYSESQGYHETDSGDYYCEACAASKGLELTVKT